MSKSTWNGTLVINLVTLPVALHKATDDGDLTFNQVHPADGGQIRYERICTVCEEVIPWENIGKGRKVGEKMVVFTDDELEALPKSGVTPKVIAIDKFIRAGAIDPTALGTAYNIVPGQGGLTAYALLRQGLKSRRKVGIGRMLMRAGGRDSLVILRPYGRMLMLQRAAWPQEIRQPDFQFLKDDVRVTSVQADLAGQLIDVMSAPWDPADYVSHYPAALETLTAAKLAGDESAVPQTPEKTQAMADIGSVLELAIAAKKQEKAGDTEGEEEEEPSGVDA